ncbi:Putative DBH-like monooxygenase protein 2 [Chelonia mydas]|uniref:Putative DBH-like monooxygenase protein 2 n=1 Tax=Chelonia mydas TaxID=8469 RepID=M7AJM1_CHEMY|nr:Putative DBH-like monooxygenase protein 2 [Chelonia mydas]
MMSLLWTKSLLFILSIPCLCSSQPSPPLLHFSAFLDHSNMVFMPWGHDKEEMINFELQVRTVGWVAFGFSPHGELPGSDIVIGGIFPNSSIYFSSHNNISSCMGYPDIQQIAHTLGQEASDAMEGVIAMNYVEWNNETIKTAEKAAKEADQIVMIKTTD